MCTETQALSGWGGGPGQRWQNQRLLCSSVSAGETPTCSEDPNLQVWNWNISLSHYILISKQSLVVPRGQ